MPPKRVSRSPTPASKQNSTGKRASSPAAKQRASSPKAKAKAQSNASVVSKPAKEPDPEEVAADCLAKLGSLEGEIHKLKEETVRNETNKLAFEKELEKLRAEGAALEKGEAGLESKIKELQAEIERRRKALAEETSKRCINCEEPLDFESGNIFETTNPGEYLCEKCAETSLLISDKKCVLCNKPFVKGEPVFKDPDDDTNFACAKCVEGIIGSAKGDRPSNCGRCKAAFGADDPIYGSGKEEGLYLCGSCAEAEMSGVPKCCSECGGPFSDGQYVDQDGAMICVPCAMKMAPVCEACGEPAFGEIARIGGKTFHMACLKCVLCKKAIEGACSQTSQGLICRPCGEEAQRLKAEAKELAAKGDVAGANRIAQRLAEKGFKVAGAADTEEEREAKMRILSAFQSWDANKDACIDEEELLTALSMIGVPNKSIQELFPYIDKNADGRIDLQEFVAFMYAPAPGEVLELLAQLVATSPKASPEATNTVRIPYKIFKSFWTRYPESDPLVGFDAEVGNATK